jgi:hypothetical protein
MKIQRIVAAVVMLALGAAGASGLDKMSAPAPFAGVSKALVNATPGTAFLRETWGRTYYGDGYVYGDAFGSPPIAVVDLDGDHDDDFIFRSTYDAPLQWLRNLGTSGGFYPGGIKEIALPEGPLGFELDLSIDFEDLNGDGRPDLVAVIADFTTQDKRVAWFRNVSTAPDAPAFEYVGTVYESGQNSLPGMWVDVADINGDGRADVFVAEDFVDFDAPHHRVFLITNTGTSRIPAWDDAVQVSELSALLPPRALAKKAAEGGQAVVQKRGPAKAGYQYRLGDIEVADWNADGVLDFMFYDKEEGVHWIRNNGTRQAPQWAAAVASAGDPLFDHRNYDLTFEEGSFALRSNADLRSREEWLDDLYVGVDGRLMMWRYFTRDQHYFEIGQSALAYATGQGPPAFWDADGDGDLDMFRTGVVTGRMLLFPNIGTPYAAAWGELEIIDDVTFDRGTSENNYRQDLYAFGDVNGDGVEELYVQRQDGSVEQFGTHIAPEGGLPTFSSLGTVLDPVPSGAVNVEPHGLALADLDQDGLDEFVIAYAATLSVDGFSSRYVSALLYFSPLEQSWHDLSGIIYDNDLDYVDNEGWGPVLVESLSAIDYNGDGQAELLLTLSEDTNYALCSHHLFASRPGSPPTFAYAGAIDAAIEDRATWARLAGAADIDADGDGDLFIGHTICGDACGENHYLTFYRNGNENLRDFWRTRAVSGQVWSLTWNGILPAYMPVQMPSQGEITIFGDYAAGAISEVVDIIESTNLDRQVRVFVDVMPPVAPGASKAVLVIGSDPSDPLYPTFAEVASFVHWVLLMEGLAPEDIRLYAPSAIDADEDGISDTYAAPTVAGLEPSITTWAKDAERVLVYLVDHGQRNRFRLSGSEYLEAGVYTGWIDQLQANGGPQVTTFIDTCEAGTWADDLALMKSLEKAGAQRITIASSGRGPIEGLALFDQVRNVSFSQLFWNALFNGSSYGEAFRTAKTSMQALNPLQVPQIDDDGDGVSNEGNDGFVADVTRPGADFSLATPAVFIGEVTGNVVAATNSVNLTVRDVVAPLPVEAVGALVVPPNYERAGRTDDDEQPVTGLDWVELTSTGDGVWEGTYTGLDEGGLYRLVYLVRSGGRYHPSPRIGYVDRVGIPDAWEGDETFRTSSWLPVNTVQGHNFHDEGDADWFRFSAPTDLPVTIGIVSPSPQCQPVVKLYRLADLLASSRAHPIRTVSGVRPGHAIEFTESFNAAGPYVLKVSNSDPELYGEGTSYLAVIAAGTGEILPTTLIVSVEDADSAEPLAGASVVFDDQVTAETTDDGITQFVCPSYGTYALKTSFDGYVETELDVEVNNLAERVQVQLQKSDEPPPPGGGCGGQGTAARAGDALLVAALAALAMIFGRRQTLRRRA